VCKLQCFYVKGSGTALYELKKYGVRLWVVFKTVLYWSPVEFCYEPRFVRGSRSWCYGRTAALRLIVQYEPRYKLPDSTGCISVSVSSFSRSQLIYLFSDVPPWCHCKYLRFKTQINTNNNYVCAKARWSLSRHALSDRMCALSPCNLQERTTRCLTLCTQLEWLCTQFEWLCTQSQHTATLFSCSSARVAVYTVTTHSHPLLLFVYASGSQSGRYRPLGCGGITEVGANRYERWKGALLLSQGGASRQVVRLFL
jgi:hypothetical protein